MREFYVSVQGTEIPILSYDYEDGKVVIKNSYYDYQDDLTTAIARKFADNYTKKSRTSIKDIITKLSDNYVSCLNLKNVDVINTYISRYLTFKDDVEYMISVEAIRKVMTDGLNKELDFDKLISVDYNEELELDPEYRSITMNLRKIMATLRSEIMSATSPEDAVTLGKELRRLVINYANMKSDIISKIITKLKDNPDYQKNKSKAYNLVPSVVEENIENYINLKENTISIEELIWYAPLELVAKAFKEIMNSKKYDKIYKIASVANVICRKRDGSKYSLEEIERVVVSYYNSLRERIPYLDYIVLGNNPEKIELDSAYDMKGPHSFKSYYSREEMDYYGHGEDDREEESDYTI